jgi:DNA-binding LacI/PurR family transcriptional regulator
VRHLAGLGSRAQVALTTGERQVRAKRATLKSIASDLGVTHTSVSNAYNNPAKVSKELRDRIIAHARAVNYNGPHPAARSLRTGRCGAIGVLFNDQLSYAFTDPHDITFLRGISTVCEEEGANIVLIPLQAKNTGQLDTLTAMVDGYILNAPYKSNAVIRKALARGLPTVVVDFDAPDHATVLTDDREMMRMTVAHLIELGHRAIAIVTFPRSEGNGDIIALDTDFSDESYVVYNRIMGCRDACEGAGIALGGVLVCETMNSEAGGAAAADRLLERRPNLTALVCFSDRLAFGCVARCAERGLAVPARMSVTGFDGIDLPGGQGATLRLTTVRQNAYEKGRKAAEVLLCGTDTERTTIRIPAEFVRGDSSAAAWTPERG